MQKVFNGVFPALPTPFTEGNEVDYDSLRRVTEFTIGAGAHGLVAMDLPGEFFTLTDEERRRSVEVVIDQVNGRIPVLVNVSAASANQSVRLANHAQSAGCDGIVSMPPFFRTQSSLRITEYYAKLASETNLPIVVQNSSEGMGSAISLEQQIKLAADHINIRYLMEECVGAQQMISAVLQETAGKNILDGVAAGSMCLMMPHDYYRGARLFIPQAELTDLFVQLWNLLETNTEAKAMEYYMLFAPALLFGANYPRSFSKQLLVHRGVISAPFIRETSKPLFDESQGKELLAHLCFLKKNCPLITV